MRPATKAAVISNLLHPIVLCNAFYTWSTYNRSKVCVKAYEGALRKYWLTQ